MTIYIVFSGSYSDRSASAVFQDRQAANNYIENERRRELDGSWSEHDDWDIEEWEVDTTCALFKDRSMWRIDMTKNGTVIYTGREPNGKEAGEEFCGDYRVESMGDSITGFMPVAKLICYCEAKDEKHAVKITNEKRIMHIANNDWPEKEP